MLKIHEDKDKEYIIQVPREYLQVIKDVFDSVERVIDGNMRYKH